MTRPPLARMQKIFQAIKEGHFPNRIRLATDNPDVQNKMRNEIDDYFFDLRDREGVPLTIERIDQIIEESLGIARMRYAR